MIAALRKAAQFRPDLGVTGVIRVALRVWKRSNKPVVNDNKLLSTTYGGEVVRLPFEECAEDIRNAVAWYLERENIDAIELMAIRPEREGIDYIIEE